MNLSGKLRHAVNIETVTNVQDEDTGVNTTSWTVKHRNVRVSIEPLSVREFLQSRTEQSEVSARIMMRYIAGLDATVRFVGTCSCHQGKVYNPAGVLEDRKSGLEYLTFPCSQGVNQG